MSELVAPTQNEVPEALRAGRAAFARHAWREGCLAGTGRVDRLDGQAQPPTTSHCLVGRGFICS
jgi:hypothetical protein